MSREAILEGLRQAVIDMDEDRAAELAEQAVAEGLDAYDTIMSGLAPGMAVVSELYDNEEYFVPEVLLCADAMYKALDILRPHLNAATMPHHGKVVIGVVQGDIHDIGKNIVVLMLKNHGYQVIDLGKDVSVETIIGVMKKSKPQVVGLSALMTTTMVAMKDVMTAARQAGLSSRFVLGGAVVTEPYAASLGAAYAKDGVEAVRVVDRLIHEP